MWPFSKRQHVSRTDVPLSASSLRSSREEVIGLDGFPQSSIGAPCPALIATERTLILIFFLEDQDPEWDGTTMRVVGIDSPDERCAVVYFDRASVHSFGPPNDEAFAGHRLAHKGLEPYGAFEVLNSEWIEQLEEMNSVHHRHDRDRFLLGLRHFIITFHDSVFECVARGYRVQIAHGSIKDLLLSLIPEVEA
jgi:hypothetical protein